MQAAEQLSVNLRHLQEKKEQQFAITGAEVQAKHDRLRALQLLHEQQHAQKLAELEEREVDVQHRAEELQEKWQGLAVLDQQLQKQQEQVQKAEAAAVEQLTAEMLQLQETLASSDSKLMLTQKLLQDEQQKSVAQSSALTLAVKQLQEQLAAAEARAGDLAAELAEVSAQHRSLDSRQKRLDAAEADVEEQQALLRANLDLLEERDHQLRQKQAAAAAAAAQLSKLKPLQATLVHRGAARVGCANEGATDLLAGWAEGHSKVVRLTVQIKPTDKNIPSDVICRRP
jgi:chromosome segregation ATPase